EEEPRQTETRVREERERQRVEQGNVREVELAPRGHPRVVVQPERETAARRGPLGDERQAPGPDGERPRASPAPDRRRSSQVEGEKPEHVRAQDDTAPGAREHREDEKLIVAAHRSRATHATLTSGLPDPVTMVNTDRVEGALRRSQDRLLRLQAP